MKSLEKLILGIRRFPGIGPKQAERIALYFLRSSQADSESFINALRDVKDKVKPCSVCFNYSEEPVCRLCSDPSRDQSLICVVEEPADVSAIERSRGFRGVYHVLHGAISPLDAVGPETLKIKELLERVRKARSTEVILATDHDTEGEATALYLAQVLKPLSVKVTRIALGVPMGGDLDYVDERTLSSALVGRREF